MDLSIVVVLFDYSLLPPIAFCTEIQTRTQSYACQDDAGSQEMLRRHYGEGY
jgi:hypothetical protein